MENNKIHEIRLIVAGTRTFDDYVLMKEKTGPDHPWIAGRLFRRAGCDHFR